MNQSRDDLTINQSEIVQSEYQERSQQRRKAIEVFLQEISRFESETRDHGKKIDEELLTAFFKQDSEKPVSAREMARRALGQLEDFRHIVLSLSISVSEMSLNLNLTKDTLMLAAIAAPIQRLSEPIDIKEKTPLDIAKQGLANIRSAQSDGTRAYLSAMSDAVALEKEAITVLQLATLLLQVRRQHLWDFRRQHLTVTKSELLERAERYGKDAGSEEVSDWFWDALEELLEAIGEELEDIIWIKRAKRWGGAVLRLAGRRSIDRSVNDTDLVHELLDRMEREKRALEKFESAIARANTAIIAVRKGADDITGSVHH